MNRKGFTLVELSIVLVIIGLLIGGILVAQSMISTARIVSFASQIQKYDIAVTNFKGAYHYYPGDAPTFSPPGDGDGFVSASGNDDYFGGEMANVWVHLSEAGMVDQKFTTPGFPSRPGVDVPKAPLADPSVGIYFLNAYDDLGEVPIIGMAPNPSAYPFFYVCHSGPGNTNTGFCGDSAGTADGKAAAKTFYPSEAYAYDQKVDDGLPQSGNVFAGQDDNYQLPTWAGPPYVLQHPTACNNGNAYNLTNTSTRACALAIKYGFATGAGQGQ